MEVALGGLDRQSYGRARILASPVFQRFPEMFGRARTLALPDSYRQKISVWNNRGIGLSLPSRGTMLDLPWYHPGTTLVP
jgi:hypothetical protein